MGKHKTYKSGEVYLYHVQCSCGKCIEKFKRFKGIKRQDLDKLKKMCENEENEKGGVR